MDLLLLQAFLTSQLAPLWLIVPRYHRQMALASVSLPHLLLLPILLPPLTKLFTVTEEEFIVPGLPQRLFRLFLKILPAPIINQLLGAAFQMSMPILALPILSLATIQHPGVTEEECMLL